MKKQSILRTILAAAAIAAAPVAFAGAAAAQSHGHGGGGHGGGRHGGGPGGSGHGGWSGGPSSHVNRGGHSRDVVIINRGPRYGHGYSYRRPYSYGPSIALGFGLGYGLGSYAYDTYYDPYYDSYSLYPGECRTDYRWDYWSGRPAEIALRICADGYGRTYVVRDSRRWVRWR
jgi:hypothetical protein